jgi:chemotaxis-related protein WspB
MLLFAVGHDLFACDSQCIMEVFPKIKLKKIPHAASYVIGLMNVGGVPVPVVDFCMMINGRPSGDHLHTRIILVQHQNNNGKVLQLGLIAEKVTKTIDPESSEFLDSGVKMKDIPYLGGVMMGEEEPVQQVLVNELFKYLEPVLFGSSLLDCDEATQ